MPNIADQIDRANSPGIVPFPVTQPARHPCLCVTAQGPEVVDSWIFLWIRQQGSTKVNARHHHFLAATSKNAKVARCVLPWRSFAWACAHVLAIARTRPLSMRQREWLARP